MVEASKIKLDNNIQRIVQAISLGNDLNSPSRLSSPCSVCNRNCLDNQNCIQCDECDKWCHIKCDGTNLTEYRFYQSTNHDPSVKWFCLYCTVLFHFVNIPFTICSVSELVNINKSDSLEFCSYLPSLEVVEETASFEKYSLPDSNLDLPNLVNSKYHSVEEFQNLDVANNFNIFHSNVNGIESKFGALHTLLNSSKASMDAIAITESSECEDQSFLSNVSLEGYKLYNTPTTSPKGGVVLYMNDNFDSFERIDLRIQTSEYQGVWVEIKNSNSKNIVCCCIYRHPRYDMTNFLNYMDSCLKILSDENKEIYLCGDFNIDLLKIDSNKTYMSFYNLLNCNGLLPFIIHPTRVVEGQIPSLIDNIFSNNITNFVVSGNVYFKLSEHFSQFASINRGKIDLKKITMFGRDYSNFSDDRYRDDVSIQRWMSNCVDPNILMSDFVWRLDGCTERHAPTKKLSQKDIKLRLKPWITNEIRKLMRIRDRLFARKKREPANVTVLNAYKRVRNKVKNEILKSKRKYHKSYFEKHNNDMKKTWEGIRKLVNVKKTTDFSISQLNVKGKIIDDPVSIANNFNNFFANVGPDTEKSVPKVPHITPSFYLKNRVQFDFIIAHISEQDILDIISSLPIKSTGPASIPIKLLKLVADLIVIPLCHIINLSFSTGVFPDVLKVAKVIVLHKGGSTQDVNNYRPISLLSIFDKIIEKLMHKRLYDFLELHNVLFMNQFGFRQKHSTAHSLIDITEQIKESIDKGKFGCGIFIDLKKAFDTVNHQILLTKLEHYGVRGPLLKWFESYLTDRKQYVFLNGVCSDTLLMTCGVPQGSVLGPLLFLLYINDLPSISDKLKFFLFADDTNIYYESDDLKSLERNVNEELKSLSLWLNLNRLALNVSKTNFVIFRSTKMPINHNVTLILNRKAIGQKDHVKYLGVLIDQHLTWKHQVNNVSKKISRGVGIIAKLRMFVNSDILLNIYYCLVYSHLSYGIEAWGSACSTETNKLLVLQKKAVRILTGNQYFQIYGEPAGPLPSSEPLFSRLGLLKFVDIFKFSISKFVYSTLCMTNPQVFSNWFTYIHDMHNHATTSSASISRTNFFDTGTEEPSYSLYICGSRLVTYGDRLIKVCGARIWNNIPFNIQDAVSIMIFKEKLKNKFLLEYGI